METLRRNEPSGSIKKLSGFPFLSVPVPQVFLSLFNPDRGIVTNDTMTWYDDRHGICWHTRGQRRAARRLAQRRRHLNVGLGRAFALKASFTDFLPSFSILARAVGGCTFFSRDPFLTGIRFRVSRLDTPAIEKFMREQHLSNQ
jgi:hypothetical protein